MSYHDYVESRRIASYDPAFAAIIMAAMRKADSGNATRLQSAFPEIWSEFEARYNAPGGKLEGEK